MLPAILGACVTMASSPTSSTNFAPRPDEVAALQFLPAKRRLHVRHRQHFCCAVDLFYV